MNAIQPIRMTVYTTIRRVIYNVNLTWPMTCTKSINLAEFLTTKRDALMMVKCVYFAVR